ncbi:MAG TPA: DUF4340 domain-containing protein, partial [Candidatus Binataceae bacterium]|nr:DUF4340 domain-containing protein [Candidatus Binataceae bacterium]
MRFRNTLIAFVVLLVVGGYAFINFYYSKPEEEGHKVFTVKPEEITKIDLKYPDRELTIERKAGEPWMLTKPINSKADQTASDNLARAIADCQVTKTVEEHPEDLGPFGLAKPQVTVTIATNKGQTLPSLDVGKTTPIGFSAYLKKSDGPAVMLTSSAFPSGMNKTVDQMRDRELMTFKVDEVNRITIEQIDQPPIEIDRDGEKWKIVKPAAYAGDSTQIRQLLSTLNDAKVADFVADAPTDVSQYGLTKPRVVVTVYTKSGQESLLFGFKQKEQGRDGVYVRRGERAPVYTVHQWVMTTVAKPVLALRDKSVLVFEPSDVGAVKAAIDGRQFELRRTDKGWDLVDAGKTSPADVPNVERFLDHIRDLRGTSIVMDPVKTPGMFGLATPPITITVTNRGGKEIGDLKLAKIDVKPAGQDASIKPHPEYYAISSASTALFAIDDFSYGQ